MKRKGKRKPLHILFFGGAEEETALGRAFEEGNAPSKITRYESAGEIHEAVGGVDSSFASLFDILVVDHPTAGKQGLDLIEEVIDGETTPAIVILVEAGAEQALKRSLELGVDDYIVKDNDNEYPSLLPLVLPEIVKRHKELRKRREAERRLAESEETYRMLTQNMIEFVFISDMDLNITFMTETSVNIIGYTPEEMIGKNIWEFYSEGDRERIENIIAEELEKGPPHTGRTVELKLFHKEGREVPVEANSKILYDDEGRPTEIQGTIRDITERKEAESALVKAQSLLRSVIEQSPIPMIIAEPDGTINIFNQATLEILGIENEYSKADEVNLFTLKQTWQDYDLDGNPIPIEEQPLAMSLKGITTRGKEVKVVRKDGTERYRVLDATPIYDGEGKLIAGFVIFPDITERKIAENSIRDSEERFRIAAESASDLIYEWDITTDDLYWFGDIDGALGYEDDEFERTLGAWLESIHPDDRERLAEMAERHRKTGEPISTEYRIRRKDGSWRYWTDHGSAMLDDSGRPVKVIGACKDITGRKAAETALRESEEKYKNLFENSIEPVYTVDLRGNFTSINKAFEDVWGYKRDEIIGSSYKNYGDPETALEVFNAYNHLYRTGEPVKDLTYRMLKKDGEEIIVEAYVNVVRKGDEIVGFQGTLRDITERKRMEEQLLRAQKMEAIGTLAGGIAHDFNNILATILGYASFLKSKAEKGGAVHGGLAAIESSTMRASELTSQLLAYSKKEKLEVRPININRIAGEVHSFIAKTFDKSIEIVLKTKRGLSTIEGDESQLYQVVMNLAINARDAMPDGGTFEMRTYSESFKEGVEKSYFVIEPGDYVCMKFTDTGIGMDEETLKRVFEPYFTTKADKGGTGLGMSVVFGIVNGHDGHIEIESMPGKGTEITVYFPASKKKEDVIEEETDVEVRGSETLLIIDDEKDILRMAESVLTEYGYKTYCVSSGREGLRTFVEKKDQIDLVILDIKMPDMGGREVLEEMVKIDPEVSVLLSSGYSDEDQHHELLRMGAVGFIGKPFIVDRLLRKVRNILG